MMNDMEKIEKIAPRYISETEGCGGATFSDVIDKINEIVDVLNGEPELRENEDERIRAQLLDFLEHLHSQGTTMDFDVWSKADCANWILWLEKQKEQKPEEKSEIPINLMAEIKQYYSDNFDLINGDNPTLSIVTHIARHFFELGRKENDTCRTDY